jgi:hypothetical protein
MRIYEPVRENLPLFHDFFRTWLLPVQLRHGAHHPAISCGRPRANDRRVRQSRELFEMITSGVPGADYGGWESLWIPTRFLRHT